MASTFNAEKWLASNSKPQEAQKEFDPNAWLASNASGAQAAPKEEGKAFGPAAVDWTRPIGYPAGIIRTGAASVASLAKQAAGPALEQLKQGNYKNAWNELGKNVVTEQEAKDAINPLSNGPPSAEEFENRLGIPKGPSISEAMPGLYSEPGSGGLKNLHLPEKGGPLDWTPRGVTTTLAEAATDPMNKVFAAMGAKPIQAALKGTGRAVYGSGLKAADIAAENMGKGSNAVSDLFFKNNIKGTPYQIAKQSDTLAEQLLGKRNDLLNMANEAGAHPDMAAALEPAKQKIKDLLMLGDPAHKDILPALQEKLASYELSSPKDLATQSAWKTNLYNALPQSKWANAAQTPVGQDFQKTLARGLKENIENQANGASQGLGDSIANANADLGVTLTAQKTLDKEAAKAIKKNALTSVDPMVFALGHASGIGLPAVAAKKTADILKGTWARTKGGKLLYDIGDKVPLDSVMRQENVWDQIQKGNKNE